MTHELAPYRPFVHYIGIDPGPVPGIVLLTRRGRHLEVEAAQCTADFAPSLLYTLLDSHRASLGSAPVIVQIEEFVVRRRASRSRTAAAGTVTRDLVGKLQREAHGLDNVKVVLHNASQVKPWATDARLQAVKTQGTDLLDVAGHVGRHAKDAARHALYAAVKYGGVPDPLSTHSAQK